MCKGKPQIDTGPLVTVPTPWWYGMFPTRKFYKLAQKYAV